MALRLGEYVLRGEIDNRRRYATTGWLELRGSGDVLRLELTGDLDEDLKGKLVRFECSKSGYKSLEEKAADPGQFPDRYVGATGEMTAEHRVKLFDCPIEEFYLRCKMGEPAPTFWRRCLYLEWFGNCGRVLVELADATVWIVEGDEDSERMLRLPDITEGPEELEAAEDEEAGAPEIEVVEIQRLDDETMRVTRSVATEQESDSSDEEDPYSLFSDDFKEMLGVSGKQEGEGEAMFLEEMETMEEIWEGKAKGDRLGALLGPAPDWEKASDEAVEAALKAAIGALGLYNVAYHVCEHMSPREACRYLFEELGDCEVHHQMQGTSWFSHFSTHEGCKQCEEEFTKEWEDDNDGDR